MSYYDIPQEEREAKGLDYDLCACLEYNQQPFVVEDIEKVLAVWEGENDGDDWRWILLLEDGRYVFLIGGCDYTGWDCQSWASSEFDDHPEKSARRALGDVKLDNSTPIEAGLGHMLSLLKGTYGENFGQVYENLHQQIVEGKNKTWREKTDAEFGL